MPVAVMVLAIIAYRRFFMRPVQLDATPDRPVAFGNKIAWVAVRGEDPRALADAIGLTHLQPANWRNGIQTAYRGFTSFLFISPPVNGWMFAVSNALPDCGGQERPDLCTPLLERLGKTFDPVLYFATHRVIQFHAWARIDGGQRTRAFAYLGESGQTIWSYGAPTKEEELGLDLFEVEPSSVKDKGGFEEEFCDMPNEENVIELAGAWSISPCELEFMDLPSGVGLVGRLRKS